MPRGDRCGRSRRLVGLGRDLRVALGAALEADRAHTRAAIYFQTEAYSTSGKKLMGRNAAGESFLEGYLKHSRTDAFCSCVKHPDQAAEFESKVREYRTEPVSAITQ